MNKTMFLLEVVDHDTNRLFKRRIANSIDSVEDWINANAKRWAFVPITIDHDGYGNGTICIKDDPKCILYTFTATNIAMI